MARVRLHPPERNLRAEPGKAARSGTDRVYVRHPRYSDRAHFLELTRSSRELHEPWISPPLEDDAFDYYVERTFEDDHEGFLVCRQRTHDIVGVINVNNIVKGSFLSASLGYYADRRFAGQGLMREGLLQVVNHVFTEMGLHRLEANIQPGNVPSINLVRSCGFEREGFSPRFLFIAGEWRDHERWAICDGRESLRRQDYTG